MPHPTDQHIERILQDTVKNMELEGFVLTPDQIDEVRERFLQELKSGEAQRDIERFLAEQEKSEKKE